MRAALLVLALLAIIAGRNAEHKATNYGFPLVAGAAPAPPQPMLFAPCPLAPRNFPHVNGQRNA